MEVTIVSAQGQVHIVNLAEGQSLTVAQGDKIRLIKNGDIKTLRKGNDLVIKKAGSEDYLLKDFFLKSGSDDEIQRLSWYDASGQEKELLSSEYSEPIQTAANETAATANQNNTEVATDTAAKDDDDGALLLLANSSGKAALGIVAGIAAIGSIARNTSSGSHSSGTPTKTNLPLDVVNDKDATQNIVTDQSANGTPVGIIALAIDPDTGNTVTYKLIDDAGGRFSIQANTGVVTVANGAALNHASAQSHVIRVLATSSDGTSAEREFTIHVKDTTPPAIPAAPTSYADNVGSIESPTSTIAVTDDAKLGIRVGSGLSDIPTLYVDGNPVAATYDPVAGTLTPSSPIPEGTHSITYTVTDQAGNESLPSSGMQITIDTLPPTQTLTIDSISLDSGITGDFVTNDSDGITVNATLFAALGAGETLHYSNDNGATWVDVTASVSGTAVSIVDATLTSTNTVQFRVTDGANYAPVASQLVTIDSSAANLPAITITTPIAGDGIVNDAEDNALIISGATSNVEAGRSVSVVFSDGVNPNISATAIVGAAGTWAIAATDISSLVDSNVSVTASVSDASGNPASVVESVLLDSDAAKLPSISITTPIAGDGIVNDAEDNALIISGATSNVEAGRSVSVVFSDGVNPNISTTAIVGAAGTWAIAATDISSLVDGNVSVTASVSDASGNPASVVESVLLDSVAPVQSIIINSISLDSAIDGDFITSDSDGLTITATLSAALDVGEVLQYSNNNGLNWREVLASEMSSNAVTIIDSALTATNTLQFRVSDGANYGPLASRLVIIDTTAPATTLTLAEDTGNGTDGITFNGTMNLTLEADVANWEYSTDSGTSWTLGVGSSFILPAATYAANAIQVKSFDIAGNSAITSYATALTVDVTAPTLTIIGDGSAGFLTFTFSEAVTGFDASDIVLMNGTAGAFAQLTTTSYRLNVTPSAGFVAPFTNIAATVNAAGYTDIAGNTSLANAENVTSLYDLFASGKVNQYANVITMDVSHVQDASNAFFYNDSFNQNISTWDTSNVTNMLNMFAAANTFNQNIGTWNTSNVTNMSGMLLGAVAFNQNIGSWDTSNVIDMSFMFRYATSFNQNIGTWDTGNVTNMSGMLLGTSAFNQNIGTWNTINVTNMSSMFYWATAFNQNIGTWNTGNVTNMSHMFRDATGFNQNVGTWNTGNVTNMTYMFQNATAFNGDISTWNTVKVTNMSLMFDGATSFNQNIGGWNTGNVMDMTYMFQNATAFNGDIGTWNTVNALDMRYMFRGASAFNQNIGAWNTAKVMNMTNMFENATAFNGDIGMWNTITVNDMRYMFAGASAFNQNIGAWNTGNVINMSYMFNGAGAFNQNIGAWSTAKVRDMSRMFNGATAFDQDIGDWDVSSLEAGSYSGAAAMLDNSGMSVANFDALLRGWSDIDTSRGETGLKNGVMLGAVTIQYSDATAFNHLTSVYGWSITNSGLESGITVGTNVADNIDESAAISALKIHALNGDDAVTGSAYDDLIVGGGGNDSLVGGAGSDTFRYYYKTDGDDSIVGFDATNPVGAGQQGDVLDLHTLLDGATQASIANFITLADAGGDTLRLDIHATGNPLATADVTVTLNGLSYATANIVGDAVWLDNMIASQHIVL